MSTRGRGGAPSASSSVGASRPQSKAQIIDPHRKKILLAGHKGYVMMNQVTILRCAFKGFLLQSWEDRLQRGRVPRHGRQRNIQPRANQES